MQDNKNKKGAGFIVQLPDGRYRAEINFTGQNGKRSRKRSSIVNTKAQAEQERKKLVKEIDRLKNANTLDIDRCSVKDYFRNQFLPYKSDLKAQSFRRLESTIDTHIIPAHGYKALTQVTSRDIRELLDEMYDRGHSHSSIKKVFDAYNAMFKFAVIIKRDILPEDNPMNAVKMISCDKFEPKEIVWLDNDMMGAFQSAAEHKFRTGHYAHKYGIVFMFMVNTGIREGEMCALKKEDIDLEEKIIRINKGINMITKKRGDGTNQYEVKVTTPKTRNSIRYVPMNDNAVKYAKEIMELYPKKDLLIYGQQGDIVRPYSLSKQFSHILLSAGLKDRGITIHSLRHTFVSHLFENGVDTQTIAEIVGDTEETVRKTYLHLFKSRKAKAVKMVNIG